MMNSTTLLGKRYGNVFGLLLVLYNQKNLTVNTFLLSIPIILSLRTTQIEFFILNQAIRISQYYSGKNGLKMLIFGMMKLLHSSRKYQMAGVILSSQRK